MKNKFFKFLFLTCLSLGTLSGCKIVEIEIGTPAKKHTVKFNSNGGSYIPSQEVVRGGKIQKPDDPTKEGYTFVNWTYQGEEWNFIGYSVSNDMTLDANWNINRYYLNLNKNINEAGNVFGEGNYDYNEQVTISVNTNPGYEFMGWYEFIGWNKDDKLITTETMYTFNIPSKEITYIAKWRANTDTPYKVEHYLQNIDDDEYELYETDILYGSTGSLTNGNAKIYEGFNLPNVTQFKINGDGSTILKLYYNRKTFRVLLTSNVDNAGNLSGEGVYKYGKKVTISATTNAGYFFAGWYEDDILITTESTYSFDMHLKNINYEARYTVNKYTITINNQADGVTISGIISGNLYDCGSNITLIASNIPTEHTIKWIRSDKKGYNGDSYSFNVPPTNITITTLIVPIQKIYSKEGNKIYFGSYPQTEVKDLLLIDELNTLAGEKPTPTNSYNWTDYNYYYEGSVTSYMFYQDIDIDYDGSNDYRGVYFTQNRPNSYKFISINTSQNDNEYFTNTIYWFRYNIIEWDILKEENGKALIIANLILDSQEYYPNDSDTTFNHNGGHGYANNYELSNIRKFINDNFYGTAFNELQKEMIEITKVDNSGESTGYSSNFFACNNTNDKMFLLSNKEIDTYYSSNDETLTQGSDYAKCQGLYVDLSTGYSNWWLRSPFDQQYTYTPYFACCKSNVINYVYYNNVGVRPACQINL